MEYRIDYSEKLPGENLEITYVEQTLETKINAGDLVHVTAPLKIDISATVNRSTGKDRIKIWGINREIVVLRSSIDQPEGELGVSCDPDGENVPVQTFNLKFRDVKDKYTDRGIVWVQPGTPTIMFFTLTGTALLDGKAKSIAEEATKAVQEQLLNKLEATLAK